VAEYLRAAGRQVWILALLQPESEDAKKAARSCRAKKWKSQKFSHSIVVDAVFGSGQKLPLPRAVASVFSRVSKSFRISLDVPSGVTDEAVDHQAFKADITLCVAHARRSLFQEVAAECFGDLVFVGQKFSAPRFVDAEMPEDADFCIAPLKRTAFKNGRVGVLAGSSESPGAAFLAAEAAHRMGVGYTELFFAEGNKLKLSLERASFLYHLRWSKKMFQQKALKIDAWILGPGGIRRDVLSVINQNACAIVLDAEALPHQSLFSRRPSVICTPHVGEAARMLGLSTREILKDRRAALAELVKLTGKTIYLKGAPGLLQIPGEAPILHYALEPSLARAGSGDVLAGILGGALVRHPRSLREALVSGLLFQRALGRLLRRQPAAISSDQLALFSAVWNRFQGIASR
jgi:NAD(P)H-hydrate epimerase